MSKEHRFWNIQPVVKSSDSDQVNEDYFGPIDEKKDPEEDIRATPLNLPQGYIWSNIDMKDDIQAEEVYQLLYENYVEDSDAMFRFNYSIEFLRWALSPNNVSPDWHIGVRVSASGLLVGFITGIPVHACINGHEFPAAEINFLCVHKKLRAKRLAPILIREVRRRVNRCDIWQAVYTAGVKLPGSISTSRYYHRSINTQKLIDVGFSYLRRNTSLAMMNKLNRLPSSPTLDGFRPMTLSDAPDVTSLLNTSLKKYNMYVHFTLDEVIHWLIPKPGIIQTYVIQHLHSEKVTDFCSFYILPSTVLSHARYNEIVVAYAYYTVANSVSLTELVQQALICAKQQGVDVFNCLDVMDNKSFLTELKFHIGQGNLYYNLFNWKSPILDPSEVALLLP